MESASVRPVWAVLVGGTLAVLVGFVFSLLGAPYGAPILVYAWALITGGFFAMTSALLGFLLRLWRRTPMWNVELLWLTGSFLVTSGVGLFSWAHIVKQAEFTDLGLAIVIALITPGLLAWLSGLLLQRRGATQVR